MTAPTTHAELYYCYPLTHQLNLVTVKIKYTVWCMTFEITYTKLHYCSINNDNGLTNG